MSQGRAGLASNSRGTDSRPDATNSDVEIVDFGVDMGTPCKDEPVADGSADKILPIDSGNGSATNDEFQILLPLDLKVALKTFESEQLRKPDFYRDYSEKLIADADKDVQNLRPDQRRSWRAHQITIAEAYTPEQVASARAARAKEFPDITNKLECAKLLLNAAHEEVQLGSLGRFVNPDFVERTRQHLRHNEPKTGLSKLFVNSAPSIPSIPLSKAEMDGLQALDQSLRPSKGPFEFPALNPVLSGSERLALPFSKVETFLPGSKAVDDNAELRQRLCTLDSPNLSHAFGLHRDKITETLSERLDLPMEWNQRFRTIERNPYMTLERKVDALHHVERLLDESDDSVADRRTKDTLAAQIILQSGLIESVDQGDYYVCNMSTIQRVLSVHDFDEVARMVADVALTGKTVTAGSDREVQIEPEWLRPADEHAMELFEDGERSLFVQYMSMIGCNQRFLDYNQKFGTHLRYGLAHNGEGERVFDYSSGSPREIFELSDDGTFRYKPKYYRFDDKRIVVDKNLRPLRAEPEDSPCFQVSDILNTYEDLSGRKGEGQLLCYYNIADMVESDTIVGKISKALQMEDPVDDRLSIYRNESELTELLGSAPYPKFFVIPGHIVTINAYNHLSKRADYGCRPGSAWRERDDCGGTCG